MKNFILSMLVIFMSYMAGAITWGSIWGLDTMWSLPFLFIAGLIVGQIAAEADSKY